MMRCSLQGGWLRIFCAFLVLIGGCAEQAEISSEKGDWFESAGTDFFNWPGRLIEDSKDTFTNRDNIVLLSLAGAASIAMHNTEADNDIQDSVENHRAVDGFFGEGLNAVGSPVTHFAVTGLWYALSAQNHDDLNKERAWTMMTALAITGVTTAGLKTIRDNDNPNGNKWAWPSGHTSSSFAFASVLDEFYGPEIGIPAYVLASLVGYRMIEEGDHWASDVVFGAALGWVIGHTVAGKHKKLEMAGFEVVPLASINDASAVGVSLVRKF